MWKARDRSMMNQMICDRNFFGGCVTCLHCLTTAFRALTRPPISNLELVLNRHEVHISSQEVVQAQVPNSAVFPESSATTTFASPSYNASCSTSTSSGRHSSSSGNFP